MMELFGGTETPPREQGMGGCCLVGRGMGKGLEAVFAKSAVLGASWMRGTLAGIKGS